MTAIGKHATRARISRSDAAFSRSRNGSGAAALEPELLSSGAGGSKMLSRCVSILLGTWLPMLAAVLPIGRVHFVNALICGTLATLLSFAALSDNRARIGMAVVGGWVALSPFIFPSTLIEEVLTVSWGVVT